MFLRILTSRTISQLSQKKKRNTINIGVKLHVNQDFTNKFKQNGRPFADTAHSIYEATDWKLIVTSLETTLSWRQDFRNLNRQKYKNISIMWRQS